MTGRRLIPVMLAIWQVFAAMAGTGRANGQSSNSGEMEHAKTIYRFSYTPKHVMDDWGITFRRSPHGLPVVKGHPG